MRWTKDGIEFNVSDKAVDNYTQHAKRAPALARDQFCPWGGMAAEGVPAWMNCSD